MTEKLVLIDYGSGNLRSAEKALARAASEAGLDIAVTVSADAGEVRAADRIVLPGVGAFGDCRKGLDAVPGLVAALEEAVHQGGKPFLGICVGMQLMAREGHEHGVHKGLGWLDAVVEPMCPSDPALKIPHMGWNELGLTPAGAAHPVASHLQPGDHAYFVHSYHMRVANPADCLAETGYGGPVVAIVGRDNFIGTQFHPEKSQAVGLKFLTAFLEWRP